VRAAATSPAIGSAKSGDSSSCRLGTGIKHVVQLTFDNVHFFRDNPDVPSNLELMPNLLNFFENNGTFFSNDHTPLIAHTADDILTTYSGLYGDRQGMPISNSYQAYNTDGTTDPAGSFALFAKPDYYLSAGSATCPAAGCVTQNPGFAYDHGDYAAEINTNYAAFALFTSVNARLLSLEKARDALAGQIKGELNDAAFFGTPVRAPACRQSPARPSSTRPTGWPSPAEPSTA
jgi:hypothetical protein